jgi:hypothetical protein
MELEWNVDEYRGIGVSDQISASVSLGAAVMRDVRRARAVRSSLPLLERPSELREVLLHVDLAVAQLRKELRPIAVLIM